MQAFPLLLPQCNYHFLFLFTTAAAHEHQTIRYELTDQALYQALARYPVKGKTVLIIGSEVPTYEAIALEYGAAQVMFVLRLAQL